MILKYKEESWRAEEIVYASWNSTILTRNDYIANTQKNSVKALFRHYFLKFSFKVLIESSLSKLSNWFLHPSSMLKFFIKPLYWSPLYKLFNQHSIQAFSGIHPTSTSYLLIWSLPPTSPSMLYLNNLSKLFINSVQGLHPRSPFELSIQALYPSYVQLLCLIFLFKLSI